MTVAWLYSISLRLIIFATIVVEGERGTKVGEKKNPR